MNQRMNVKTEIGTSEFELRMENGEYSIYCYEYDDKGDLKDSDVVKSITPSKERAEEIFDLIVRNCVSACTLEDVIVDLIC
ncbi:MAG: hypothetical protein J6B29_05400 [Clostridia bacterium]|nr:hypothetical protein [Clostridia bacterium]